MPKPPVHFTALSLGLGIQSTTLSLLIEAGEMPDIPYPDAAIFADTKAEAPHTYETLEWLRERVSFPIYTTTSGDLARNTWKALSGMPVPERGHHKPGYIDLPVFSHKGIGRRQCTGYYKLKPIRAKIRELANAAPPSLTAVQYIGISTNESHRAKQTNRQWLTSRFPLIEYGWSRADCQDYLDNVHPGHNVSRSSCWFCPFRTGNEWRDLRDRYPSLYTDAVAMERALMEHHSGPWTLAQGGIERKVARLDVQPSLLDQLSNTA